MIYGWYHPATAERYEAFCGRHGRYQEANRELVAHGRLVEGVRTLDLAAGTGRTAEAALACGAQVVCWEPAEAMRVVGRQRVPEAEWLEAQPEGRFERVLCGAAAWQWRPFSSFVEFAGERLEPGGAAVFAMPSLYLGVADEPGGGEDPLLYEFPARLARGRTPRGEPDAQPLTEAVVAEALAAGGLKAEPWSFRLKITQACQCDWYRIPVLTDALLGDLDLAERDDRVERAARESDSGSWKWEGWTGWTAWRR